MNASISIILVVVGAYLAAHVAFGWLSRRFLIISGAEYLLLGILLGPQLSGLINTSVFHGFAPFMTLALGWVGALVGAQFHLPELMRFDARAYRVAFFEATGTLVVVSGAMLLTLQFLLDVPIRSLIIPAIAAGAMGVASSPAGIALVARKLGRTGPIVRQLQLTTAIDSLVAIVAFGVILSLAHPPPTTAVRPPTATEWMVISIAIGCVGGALFHLFLGEERKIDRLFIGLAGAIILASGAASYLRLSPLLPAMLIGAILVNTSSGRDEIRQALSALERPIYFVLLIFAGAAWQQGSLGWVIPVVVFLGARTLGKLGMAYLAGRVNGVELAPGWGQALLGHGGLAVAIGLNYLTITGSNLAAIIFSAVLASVLVTDVTSARLAGAVVRAGGRRAREERVAKLQDQVGS